MNRYSIILPLKNGGSYLKECVSSVLSQTYKNYNFIILDNCSTDGSLEWLKSLKSENIVIHKARRPLSIEENWARVKSIPKNEFITLIGHDDILLPGYLEEMDRLINTHPDASLYQTHFTYIDPSGEFIRSCKPMTEVQTAGEFLAFQFTQTIDSTGTGYMMRSKDYDAVGGIPAEYPDLIFADYKLWVELSVKSYKVTSEKVCFKYRIHNSVSKLTGGDKYQAAFEKYIYFIAELSKRNVLVREVVQKYGPEFLVYNCESLAHRILKTPPAERKIKVKDFIAKCEKMASIFIPGQDFEPMKKIRINIAAKLDNPLGRFIFQFYKMFTGN